MTLNEALKYELLDDNLYFNKYFFKQRYKKLFITNWHHEILCNAMNRILSGDCKRLLIRMPPRYGKTEIAVKGLISAGLAVNPASKFIHLSYSAGLASDNSEECRDFIQEPAYKELFPYVQLSKSSTAKNKWYTTEGGGVYATSTGGQITGFGAGELEEELNDALESMPDTILNKFSGAIIIDDPVKPDDADSETKRERINDRFETTIRSRANSRNTPIIVIGQAVHERDLIGYLMANEPDKWELITLPAIYYDDGIEKALWEHRHTLEELHRLRDNNEFVFATQYQQDPRPKEGILYPKDELNYFDIDDLRIQDADGVVMVGDIADEGDDSLSIPVGYLFGNKVYIADVIFTPEPVEITTPRVAEFINQHRPDKCVFESNNGGKQYAQAVNKLITHRVPVKWKPTTQNKHTRILMKAGDVKQNFYFRNDDKRSKEYIKFMSELYLYQKTGKVKHDDAPDAITMMAELLNQKRGVML